MSPVESPPSGGSLSIQTELPVSRAFVVQLQGSSAIANGEFAGRVEHVLSGRRWRFESLAELVAVISQSAV